MSWARNQYNKNELMHCDLLTSWKSLNICTWSSAPYTVTEKLLCIIKGPMKVISGLLPETWGYFCMKNFIFTTWNCHSHIHESTHFILFALLKVHPRFFIPRLACGPPKLMGPGALAPADTPPPSQWAWYYSFIVWYFHGIIVVPKHLIGVIVSLLI